jgi:hypothetical protein
MSDSFIKSAIHEFQYYKSLGEKTFSQLSTEQLNFKFNDESNSIATIVKHLSGNMLSRWTDFLNSDGEKQWRNRDQEFTDDEMSENEISDAWKKGWDCLFHALKQIESTDLERIILIRNEKHTVTEAINRQIAHYAYHVGQIVLIGKCLKNNAWISLSIPKNKSAEFNSIKFSEESD